ncbi:hypothetical protein Pcinc_002536, partial [Petrolisthes cinctipes]
MKDGRGGWREGGGEGEEGGEGKEGRRDGGGKREGGGRREGPTQPKQLNKDVVFPPALRLYKWAWQLSTRRHHQENTEQGKQGDVEEG